MVDMSADANWALYRRRSHDERYANFKLISLAPRPHKANFHLGFHIPSQRLVRSYASRLLVNMYPELVDWVVSTMQRAAPVKK